MYLTLRPPWGSGGNPSPAAAEVAEPAPGDASVGNAKPAKKRAGKRRPPGATVAAGDEHEVDETEPESPPLTDADRRLEWRGDDVTLPATRIDMGGGAEGRPLDDREINATINAHAGGVRACVVRGASGTDLRGTITVKLVVDASGKVTKSKLQAPRYLLGKGLLECTQKALRGMKFPATGAPTLVTLPVTLG